MKLIDRILVCVLALGIWAWVFLSFFSASPLFALYIGTDDVDGLKSYVEDVVEDCKVKGEVYVYEIYGGEGYGNISSAQISC